MRYTQELLRKLAAGFCGGAMARCVLAAACSCLLLVASVDTGAAAPASRGGVHAFLLRGFANIFSLGLDEFAPKLRQRGIRADVYNHLFGPMLVTQMVDEYRSGRTRTFILIGHSMGAVAVIDMVAALADKGVPINLAVTLDAADTTLTAGKVNNFVNLYIGNGVVGGVVRGGPNFHGHITNVDLSTHPQISHISIPEEPIVQDLLLKYVARSLAGGIIRAPAHPAKRHKPLAAARD